MIKKLIAKNVAKKVAKVAAMREAKIVAGALLTIGTHKAIQRAARRYRALDFLRT